MIKRWISLSLAALLFAPVVRGGTVLTRDGQTLSGEVSLTAEGVTITPANGPPRHVAMKDLARASFADPAGPSIEYAAVKREKGSTGPRHVLAEYFADREMTDRRLARYEGPIQSYWPYKTSPDPAIPAQCAVRFTTRVVSKRTQEYTFGIDAHGPVRLWLDGKLKIDQWGAGGEKHFFAKASLTADKPVAVLLEVGGGEASFLARLHWSGDGVKSPHVPAEAYLLPEGASKAPGASLLSPPDESHFRSPPVVAFEVRAEAAAGKLKTVDLIAGNEVLGSMTSAPYRFDWKGPPPGVYKVRVRATDEKGISAYSEAIDVSVADAGGSLPAPWGQQTLGKKETRVAGSASFREGTFTITKAGGQITEESDQSQFVYQPVNGDFEVVTRLASLTPNSNQVGPLAGIMVRENMTPLDRFAAVVVGPEATTMVCRQEHWGRSVGGARAETAAKWVKLVRHANRLRTYTSADGKAWSLLGADRLELPERVFVGICAMSRDKESAATAVFDHVAVTNGPPALVHATEGVLFRSGTFLAAEVLGIKEGKLIYNRDGKRIYLPNADVARLVYKAVPAELAEEQAGGVGVLLASGDFVEGEVQEINYRVRVSNLVFGPRTFTIKGNDVLAIYLREPEVGVAACTVTAADGSVYRTNAIKVTGDAVSFDDLALGRVELPRKALAELRIR